ncbi:hypothetical protein FRB97_007338 [Tulasnella sp. 331]|nr:hypothetical protein FRB97_007338 [Tulasnella sp. 331]
MFKFGKKKTEQKEPKEQKKKLAPAEKTLKKAEPIKIQFEEASPLAKAKAAADKKLCHVAERGLPLFEEFGARPSERDAGEDRQPDTIKASSTTAPEDGLKVTRGGPVSGGLPSRSPSPQPPANLNNATQRRPPAELASRERIPQPPAQQYEQEYPEYVPPPSTRPTSVYPAMDSYGQPLDPRYTDADYYSQSRSLDDPHYPPQQGYPSDQYYEQPRPTPTPYYDPPREPAYPPTQYYDAEPQYPSPGPDRYAPPVAERFAGGYGDPTPYHRHYDDLNWRTEAPRYPHTPPSRYSRHWDPAADYPEYDPPLHASMQYGRGLPWSPYDSPHHPQPLLQEHRRYEQPGYYPHHQRARTMDSEPPYGDWPPIATHHRPPPDPRGLPSHTSHRELSAVAHSPEPLRRRSYSLQPYQNTPQLPPALPPQANLAQEQPRRRRSQRYSDYTGLPHEYENPVPPDPRWPGPPQIQPRPPIPTPSQPQRAPLLPAQQSPVQEQLRRRRSKRHSDYTGLPHQYQSSTPSDPRRAGPPPTQSHPPLPTPPHHQRVASLTQQLNGLHIESPTRPGTRPPPQAPPVAREQSSPTKSLRDPEHFGTIYNAPPASRSSSSFDFSSPSSSPSPASRTRPSSVEEKFFDLPHSSSRTSLHSVPEVEQEEDECVMSESPSPSPKNTLPTLEQFRRKRVAPPVWHETHQEDDSHAEQEEYPRQKVTLERRAPSRKSETDLGRQRTRYRPQPPPEEKASIPDENVSYEAMSASDHGSEAEYGQVNEAYYDSTAHNSPATNRTVTATPLKGEQVSSSSPAPNTPSRQRTVMVKGPRGPRSPF